ncbi:MULTISPECIES: hypothetical protein [unclassified Saccharibacter]|uniref:hypothetical protein n=1 Tax=unclassified Saccharibacter TaxID=2648722 RepID=UPI0013246F6B|nr:MULTISPECIES: hypothetical protein [unclassified Saccharibacter]MXV36574.1 hypothetical protein [Saccharibacter sp. EH611]MXV57736.1 hypothetical protein [Saccharibacter sp. EH70]MXV64957.1 hypothetical protein [Saccharibacter sp. EH60]
MEEKISLKIIWFLVSFLLCFIFILLMKISYSKTKDPSLIYFLYYFMASGFISMAIIGKENTKIDILQRSGLSLIISVILLVPLHQATAPIMNVIMSIMGYRSNAEEAIFVDDDAAHKLTNVLSLYNKKLSACSIMIGPQRMWRLENGVITLQGIGEKIYIHIPNLPSQSFQAKQVLTLPSKGLNDCQFPQRITTNAPHKVPIDTAHQASFHEPHIGFPDDPPPKKN